jgi:teichuronic acid biosynthesis glycosyltransferase TuaG
MAQQPLVSVIVPTYNYAHFIGETLECVRAQTCPDWECIVVDDGSTDNTATIVGEFAARDRRIEYVFQENGKQGKARNTAIAHARAPLLAFLDADDLWEPNKLALQLRALEETGADIVYSDGTIFGGAENHNFSFKVRTGLTAGPAMLNFLLLHNTVPLASVLMRRSVLDAVGGFEEGLEFQACEDYELWLKAAKAGAVFLGLPDKLVRYRRHQNASTHRESNVLKPMLRVVARHIDAGTLPEIDGKWRIRGLYRRIIEALLNEERPAEAIAYMRELAEWDKTGTVTSIQKVLLKVSPRIFNFVSRELLYRTEWHLSTLSGNKPSW